MQPLFIAEIGINHHGNLSKAFRMVKLAKDSGAHIAKFQYYDPVRLLGANYPDLDYIIHCQFKQKDHERLATYCKEIGIEYLVSVFEIQDVAWAASLCKRMKVASRMNRNLEFLSYIDRTKLPVIMSIQPDLSLRKYYQDRFYFMWCRQEYPATYGQTIAPQFSYKYGLSSHCPDWNVIPDAYKKGARIFENHVCESRSEKGCDISSSITFDELKRGIESINHIASGKGKASTGV